MALPIPGATLRHEVVVADQCPATALTRISRDLAYAQHGSTYKPGTKFHLVLTVEEPRDAGT